MVFMFWRNHIVTLPLAAFIYLLSCGVVWANPDPGVDNFTKITTQGQLGGNFPFFSTYIT